MNKEEFLVEFKEMLQREEPVKETDKLDDYEEWDSLSKMALIAFFNKVFAIRLSLNTFKPGGVLTVSDIIRLAGDKIQ